jgi:hypothetical protein
MDSRDITDKMPELKEGENVFFKIWEKQAALVKAYQEIEGLPEYPIQLNTRKNQNLIKDFMGRVVEELVEAREAELKGEKELWMEELIDAVHFLVEIFIYVWGTPEAAVENCEDPDLFTLRVMEVKPLADSDNSYYWNVVYHLMMARNHLRNKDWKQTQVLPKTHEFLTELHNSLYALNWLFSEWEISPAMIWEYYCKKNLINWFRIKSKY